MGPGKTPSKEVLWSRNNESDDFHIRLTADFTSENKTIKAIEITPVSEAPLMRPVSDDLVEAARNFDT